MKINKNLRHSNSEPLQVQYLKHLNAEQGDGNPKDIVENVSISAADGIRGDLTGKVYDMPAAIKMNEKYDKLAAANYFRREPHKDKLSASEAIIAMATGADAANYHKQDPKLIKNYNELRAKRNRILNQVKLEKKRKNKLLESWGLKKKDVRSEIRKGIREADEEKLKNKKIKVASKPKPNGHDTQPNVIPIGPIPHSKPWYEERPTDDDDAAYKFRFKDTPRFSILDKIKLQSDLQKAYDNYSGIGSYDNRRRLANGGNGSTKDWDEKHPFTKKIQEIYNIQLTGQETFGELMEIVRKLNEQK
jgi:hypothetical protein